MKIISLILLFLLSAIGVQAQSSKNDNKVILISLDGLRWQELFGGADSVVVNDEHSVDDIEHLKRLVWKDTKKERRETLFPFIWSTVSTQGVLAGNRWENSNVNLTNKGVFSFPGYNEILTGFADDNINSNSKKNNPNVTVLEAVNKTPKYNGKVLAFGSWDVFPYIINEERSGIPVNAGYKHAITDNPTENELLINKIQDQTPKRWGSVRFDTFTHQYAIEAMKREHPSLVYVAYGETDDFAHDGRYDYYLQAAHNTDQLIKDLWEFTQNDPFYKGKTTFIITTDHGRGSGIAKPSHWDGHGDNVIGATSTWIIAFGNGVKAQGELMDGSQYYNNQVAATVAKILGVDYDGNGKAGKALDLIEVK